MDVNIKYKTEMISTTMLAYNYSIPTNLLYNFLRKIGWIEKVDHRWRLTSKGVANGGIYSGSDYINWPNNLLDKREFFSLNPEPSKGNIDIKTDSSKIFEGRGLKPPDKGNNKNIKCKIFKISITSSEFTSSESFEIPDLNSFLQKVEVISTHASLVRAEPESWSVLVFYKDKVVSPSEDTFSPTGKLNISTETQKLLLRNLRDWRLMEAKRQKVPPYLILQHKILSKISKNPPISIGDLSKIPGMGKIRNEKYGSAIIQIIRDVLNDNSDDEITPVPLFMPPIEPSAKAFFLERYEVTIYCKSCGTKVSLSPEHLKKIAERIDFDPYLFNFHKMYNTAKLFLCSKCKKKDVEFIVEPIQSNAKT